MEFPIHFHNIHFLHNISPSLYPNCQWPIFSNPKNQSVPRSLPPSPHHQHLSFLIIGRCAKKCAFSSSSSPGWFAPNYCPIRWVIAPIPHSNSNFAFVLLARWGRKGKRGNNGCWWWSKISKMVSSICVDLILIRCVFTFSKFKTKLSIQWSLQFIWSTVIPPAFFYFSLHLNEFIILCMSILEFVDSGREERKWWWQEWLVKGKWWWLFCWRHIGWLKWQTKSG